MEKIEQETLQKWLEEPDVLILDVRAAHDWDASNVKIKHARRYDPTKYAEWGKNLPRDKRLVLY